jgi:hypothetical protein
MTHDEMIAVITHHKNGGKVQCRCKGDGVWIRERHLDALGFNFATFDYRAKPEPLVMWQLRTEGSEGYGIYRNREEAEARLIGYNKTHAKKLTLVKFVEVTE